MLVMQLATMVDWLLLEALAVIQVWTFLDEQ
jgi:hypothetical protein